MWPCFEPRRSLHQIPEKPDWDITRARALGKRRVSVGSSEVAGTRGRRAGSWFPSSARSLREGQVSGAEGRPSGAGPRRGCPPLRDVPEGGGPRAGSAPSPPPPGAGSDGPREMRLPPLHLLCTLLRVRPLHCRGAAGCEVAPEPGHAAGSRAAGHAVGRAAGGAPGRHRPPAER